MRVKCNIDNIRTNKSGMKIVLNLDEKASKEAMKFIHNFMDKPLNIDFQVDALEQKLRLAMISPEQRAKVYALFKDIADYSGNNIEVVKASLKQEFCKIYGYEMFSLSNCKSQVANDFITFLVGWCFINAVKISDHPKNIIEDIESYLYLCLKYSKCAICGKPADEHHVDAIGMGRDRMGYDDSDHGKIALCREHHTEAHAMGWESFAGKYHVQGIKFTG